MTNIPDVEKFLSRCTEVGQTVLSVSKANTSWVLRPHSALYKLISSLRDENILSACLDFSFDTAWPNSAFRWADLTSKYFTMLFTSCLCISSIKVITKNCSLTANIQTLKRRWILLR